MHLFLDGKPVATGNGPGESGTGRLSLGVSNQLHGQSFIGSFDEIRIYQCTLSAKEIASLAQRNTQ